MTDERAEDAFRSAFRDRAGSLEPVLVRVPPTPRPTWMRVLVVAAAVVLIATLGVVLARRQAHAPPTNDPHSWRWESYRDIEVRVPASWGYAYAPRKDECASTTTDGSLRPHVSGLLLHGFVALPTVANGGVACDAAPPSQLMALHLSFGPDPDAPAMAAGWQTLRRIVGGQLVSVVTDRAHADLASRILDSAHVIAQDTLGCPATSPIQETHPVRPPGAFDVAEITSVKSVTVCQYDLGVSGPGLAGSRRLTGAAAQHELAALQHAPPTSGPNRSSHCSANSHWDTDTTAVVLLLATGDTTHELYGYYQDCHDNGFDDGTHVHAVTQADCSPLFGGRVLDTQGIEQVIRLCDPKDFH